MLKHWSFSGVCSQLPRFTWQINLSLRNIMFCAAECYPLPPRFPIFGRVLCTWTNAGEANSSAYSRLFLILNSLLREDSHLLFWFVLFCFNTVHLGKINGCFRGWKWQITRDEHIALNLELKFLIRLWMVCSIYRIKWNLSARQLFFPHSWCNRLLFFSHQRRERNWCQWLMKKSW